MARIVALMTVAVLAAAPAATAAAVDGPPEPQGSPFQQAPAPSQNQVGEQPGQTEAPPQTPVDDGSVGGREALLIAVGIIALIGGIWFVIARDAKRATVGRVPATGGATRASRRGRRPSAAERKRRKRGRATK
jgi:hypothetical protein